MVFSHSEPVSEPAPTAVDLANLDAEKHDVDTANVEHADTANTAEQHGHHFIDPALERRVVRKMDLRLVPLVTVLCTILKHADVCTPSIY